MLKHSPITVVGVSESHCATACLLRDGKIIASVSEERLNRIKNWGGFPTLAVQEILRLAGLEADDVDRVVLHGNSPWMYGWYSGENDSNAKSRGLMTLRGKLSKALYRRPAAWSVYQFGRDKLYRARVHKRWNRERMAFASEQSGVPFDRIHRADHHLCHAYAGLYGVYGLPKEEYLVLTNDGHGDDCCSTVSTYQNGTLRRLASTPNEHSLADVYMEITRYLGMKTDEHEYKVMGLAPYAGAVDVERTLAFLKPLVWRSGLSFGTKVPDQAYYDYLKEHLEGQRFDWVAGAVQMFVESLLCEWVTEAIRQTGIGHVVLSGGIFHNVKANMCIGALPEVETLRICPSPGDESTAIGAAYWGYEQECLLRNIPFEPQPIENLYLGASFSDKEIEQSIERFRQQGLNCTVEHCEHIEERIAELLSRYQIVARFDGRMEFGARALGNRSILAHPSNPRVIDILNRQIKNRDFWMPFAGTILSERQHDYLINPKSLPAPYMVLAYTTTSLACAEMLAAMHPADHTMRPQILDRATNPGYYEVLKQFEARTGIGGVLNTSFNLHGEPIVNSPDEALATFSRSGLRHLALGNFLLSKSDEEPANPALIERVAQSQGEFLAH
ncbi:MAG TPA: carbamoyltransferase C-terminal domain-containing protein [Ktedonobacteraceae bacterium]|nr:carbamoyltransferase C-terminal domain-containing protein [Ktedonobacteraceae bacterium]